MTIRESVHEVVDRLPEDRLDEVLDYLAELSEPDEPLRGESLAALDEGLQDIRNGSTISLDEYRRTRGL